MMIHCGLLALVSGKLASRCFIGHITGKLLLIAASWDMLFLECRLLVMFLERQFLYTSKLPRSCLPIKDSSFVSKTLAPNSVKTEEGDFEMSNAYSGVAL